jgi:HK97 family phage portal protein
MEMKSIGLNPEESLLNESRTFQVNEISRVFGVPVHHLAQASGAALNSIEAMNTTFVTLCLRPWAVKAEQEMLIKLLTRDEKQSGKYFFRHNFEGLLRGDTAARSSFYASAILNGYMTRNEVREKENLNTIEGLDKPLVPVNMAIINADGQIEAPPAQDTNTPDPGEPGSGGKKQDNGTPQSAAA